jgi:Flp pilus assembly protein TadG
MADGTSHACSPGLRSRGSRGSSSLRCQSGQALVEFALVALPLFLVVFGIIDYGRALAYYNHLTQLAGQGARAAAVDQGPNGGLADGTFQKTLADEAATNELRSGIKVCIVAGPDPAVGDPITVTTSYDFNFLPLISRVHLTLTASQTERLEAATADFTPGCSGA